MRKTLTLSALAAGLLFVSKGSTQTPPGAYAVPLPLTPQAYPPPIALLSPVPAMPPQPPSWQAPRVETARLVTKVFDITEIVMQVGTKGTPPAIEDRAGRLTTLLEGFIEPASWKCAGGRGSMVFFTENCSLVVNNESRVVANVEAWLEKLRAPTKSQVKVSTVHVRCEADALCKLGLGDRKPNEPTILNADQLALVRKGMVANGHFEVITAPQFHLDNGQTGFFQVGGNNIDITSRVTPTVAPDGRTILVQMESRTNVLAGTKVVIDAKTGETATAFNGQSVQGAYAIPNGGTVLVSLGTQTVKSHIITKVPLLANLPQLDVLFNSERTEPRQYETFVLVTANTKEAANVERLPFVMPVVSPQPQVMTRPVVAANNIVPVADGGLLSQIVPPPVDPVTAYRKACREGRLDDARRFASQALAADPKCFEKK